MKSNACQFRGVNQTMAAYIANDVPTWSLKNGPNQLLFKYDGTDMTEGEADLRATLAMLYKGGSAATYTLCVYEDWKKGQKIKNNTPYDNSFNFCIFEEEEDRPYNQRKAAYLDAVDERMNRMEAMLKNLTEAEDVEEEEGQVSGFQKAIAGLLTHPQVVQALAGKVVGLIENIVPMNTIGKVAGVTTESQPADSNIDQEEKTKEFVRVWGLLNQQDQCKVSNALTILLKSDQQFPDHIEKLADMSINNVKTYNMALKFL